MSTTLVVYGFETSNNYKVRMALGYKGLDYEFRTIDKADRSEVLEVSGQRLTPVLVHGKTVLFDSAAILRYLDTNFPDTPKLFSGSHAEQWEIDSWEMFGRYELAGPMMTVVHKSVLVGQVDDSVKARCQEEFEAAVARLMERLSDREWLVGERLTAADITVAAVLRRIREVGLFQFPAGAEDLLPYEERLMKHDGPGRA
jgi:glutathione S-transferase